jgi:hypothetical protein
MEDRNRTTVALGQPGFPLSRFPGDSEFAISAFPLSRDLSAFIGVHRRLIDLDLHLALQKQTMELPMHADTRR